MQDVSRRKTLAFFSAVCLVFVALPLILLSLFCGRYWAREERFSAEQVCRRLDTCLIKLRHRENPERYLAEQFLAVFQWVDRQPDPLSAWSVGLRNLRERLPGSFQVVIVDGQGEVVENLTQGQPPKRLYQKLFQALLRYRHNTLSSLEIRGMWPTLHGFIGSQATPEQVFSEKRLLREVRYSAKGHYFFPVFSDHGGAFFTVDRDANLPWRPYLDQLQRQKQRSGNDRLLRLGLLTPDALASASPEEALAMEEFRRIGEKTVLTRDSIFRFLDVGNGGCLFARSPRGILVSRESSRFLLSLASALLFGSFSWWLLPRMLGRKVWTISIRRRLVGLFLFASGVPLAVVGMIGFDYLQELRWIRTREMFQEIGQNLRSFDARFGAWRLGIERSVKNRLQGCRFQNPVEEQESRERLRELINKFSTTYCQLFDRQGKLLWDQNQDGAQRHGDSFIRGKVLGEIVSRLASQINGESAEIRGGTDLLLGSLENFNGGVDPLAQLARSLGQMTDFSSGREQAWLLLIPLPDSNLSAARMVVCHWRKREMERAFLQQELFAMERNVSGLKLLAFSQEDAGGFHPEAFPLLPAVLPVCRSMRTIRDTVEEQLRFQGKTWLTCAVKPTELKEYFLLGASSDQRILDELIRWRQFFLGFGILMLAVSSAIGLVLSRRFLDPIRWLNTGVEAVEQRRFTFRIPELAQDELGRLAATFNRVLEGLSDLEVARIVQESLFPKEEISVGPYRIFGESHPATQLGGDYFDLRHFPDGRLLILVGDVTGHGVPAALVMALAKGVVSLLSSRQVSPEEILRELNSILFENFQRKLLMPCFLALLDPMNHRLMISDAGHCYPILVRRNESPKSISQIQFPLGSRKDFVYQSREVVLQPGDYVVFYTDGFVETRVGDDVLGFNRFLEEVACHLDPDPRKSCHNLFAWNHSLANSKIQEDDVTLLVLTVGEGLSSGSSS